MAYIVGEKVHAVDQLGHWEAAKVLEYRGEQFLVGFPNWPGYERQVCRDEIRQPCPTREEASRSEYNAL